LPATRQQLTKWLTAWLTIWLSVCNGPLEMTANDVRKAEKT